MSWLLDRYLPRWNVVVVHPPESGITEQMGPYSWPGAERMRQRLLKTDPDARIIIKRAR